MRIVLFGGSFDPVHCEHVAVAVAAKRALSADRVVVVPSKIAPHKSFGARASGEDRLAMLKAAFDGVAEVSEFELNAAGTSYTYLTCEHFYRAEDELFLLMGLDMLEDFPTWKFPERILACATLAVCGRERELGAAAHADFRARFHTDFAEIPYTGKAVSSTEMRVLLAFGERPAEMPEKALDIAKRRGLYTHPAILPALALEKEERRAHSLRVAETACRRARTLGVEEERALLAAALHDCGKSVPPDSPLLDGFTPPEKVPAPVLHQFTGAYLAEHAFGVRDAGILDAIRYHTSGRAEMADLEMLIYLSDLLEAGRAFDGIEELRTLFRQDLGACLFAALEGQIAHLRASGKPIYPLTIEAYEWAKRRIKRGISTRA